MHPFPHRYQAQARGTATGPVGVVAPGLPEIAERCLAADGTCKYLLRLLDGVPSQVARTAAAEDALHDPQLYARDRGRFVQSPLAPYVIATVHPSSILRAPDAETRRAETAAFVADLKKVARKLTSASPRSPR